MLVLSFPDTVERTGGIHEESDYPDGEVSRQLCGSGCLGGLEEESTSVGVNKSLFVYGHYQALANARDQIYDREYHASLASCGGL